MTYKICSKQNKITIDRSKSITQRMKIYDNFLIEVSRGPSRRKGPPRAIFSTVFGHQGTYNGQECEK